MYGYEERPCVGGSQIQPFSCPVQPEMCLQQPEAGYVSLTHKPLPLPAVEDSEAKFGNRLSVIPPTLLHSESVFSFLSPFVPVTPYLSAVHPCRYLH